MGSKRRTRLNWREHYKMSKLATVDRGYHVYVAVWDAAVGQILPCKRERSMIPTLSPLSRIMTRPFDNDTRYRLSVLQNFHAENFRELPPNREIRESCHRERFPRYSGMTRDAYSAPILCLEEGVR